MKLTLNVGLAQARSCNVLTVIVLVCCAGGSVGGGSGETEIAQNSIVQWPRGLEKWHKPLLSGELMLMMRTQN